MHKPKLLIIIFLAVTSATVTAQTYSTLWKIESKFARNAMPRSQLKTLQEIADKAEAEKAYGQLLKATVKSVAVWDDISADSVAPAIARIEAKETAAAKNLPLRAVYDAALFQIYEHNKQSVDNAEEQAAKYKEQAMERPDKLASTKALGYEPFVVEGSNSNSIFNDDLLSVIGFETGQYDKLHAFYSSVGNRRAACITALQMAKHDKGDNESGLKLSKSPYIQSLDSLIKEYSDLDVCGEVAVERYNHMRRCADATAEDKIKYIHYALERWGGWQRMGELRNAERSLTSPQYLTNIDCGVIASNIPQTLRLRNVRNTESVTMRIYATKLNGDTDIDIDNDNSYKQLKKQLALLDDKTVVHTFPAQPSYQEFNDSIVIPGLPAGVYVVTLSSDPTMDEQRFLYRVSDVSVVLQGLPNNNVRYVVVSTTTGQPIENATIRLRNKSDKGNSVTLTTDKNGEATYKSAKGQRYNHVYAYTSTDRSANEDYVSPHFYFSDNKRHITSTRVFADRSIYRPGQTVHAAAIVYDTDDRINYKAVAGKTVKASLYDSNNEVVDEKELTTDSYGKCSVDFTLPTGKLTGNYCVSINNSNAWFNVEEYKRPTFRVDIPEITEKYQDGDTIYVNGKAASYAGIPLQGAKVRYKVTRQPAYWWRAFFPYGYDDNDGSETLYSDDVTTADDGSFEMMMPMSLPKGGKKWHGRFYTVTVTADVTDASGETHCGTLSTPLADRAAVLTSSLPSQVLTDSVKQVTFYLRNMAGLNVEADVKFRIDDNSEWRTAKTTAPFSIKQRLSSGAHTLTAICEGDTLRQAFTAFSLNDTKPCVATDDWFYVSSSAFPADGTEVTVQVGASDNIHVVYSIAAKNEVIESGHYDLSNELKNIKLKYREEYGDGLLLTFAWYKNGKFHSHSAKIQRPLPDKSLKMEWTTFRDRLSPGQSEEWRLKVTTADGKATNAQLMAVLYDQSLDQIKSHAWHFSPAPVLSLPSTVWENIGIFGLSGASRLPHGKLPYKNLSFSHFDKSVFNTSYIGYALRTYASPDLYDTDETSSPMVTSSAKRVSSIGRGAMELMATNESSGTSDLADADQTVEYGKASSRVSNADQVRENLNETAFFYPALRTDGEGNIVLSFTLPESLTTWRFMGLAHTQDMAHGTLTDETVAQKPVMVQPNVPRFLRTGDKAQITTRIANTTGKAISGTAHITLSDPSTDKIVYAKDVAFTAEAEKTAAVTFDYTPDGQQSLLVCKITANGDGFSDGEQHYLPILPDHERVTVTSPFSQNGAGTKTINIDKLFPKNTTRNKLTVEYTNNPAWLVIQSLPYAATANDDNAISQAVALYANAIGRHVANISPKIKQTFKLWKQEERDNAATITSPLARNAELKDIALSETPWVGDADNETEQKHHLTDFFDDNTMDSRITTATKMLRELQNDNGSWSWWRGMDGSYYMTLTVAQTLARLQLLVGQQSETADMLNNAMTFLDKKIVEEVNNMKRREREGHPQLFPGMCALQYLYTDAIMQRSPSTASARQAREYLINLMKKDTKVQTIYATALAAIIYDRNGEKSLAKERVQSLKEYLVNNEEMGCYYDTRKAELSWYDYKIPTHVAALEAIQTITSADTNTIDGMRRWLLQEKRTQAWDTPINTANAVYAFLRGNTKLLDAQEQTTFAIDGKPLAMPKATAAIGYTKAAIDNPTGKTLTATKTSDGTSWGAVYAQFTQQTADINSSNSSIGVKREIVSNGKELRVGDRIKVKITIEAKRDLDFVQVVDRRAACMEPVAQLSGYRYGYYCSPKDNTTNYYFDRMAKGHKVVIETEYYIDRAGEYETGTCTAGCAYAPEYRATAKSEKLRVKN